MTVSIIIAVKAYCENLKECVSKCLELEYKGYEIIILPDSSFPKEGIFSNDSIRIIPTGYISPPYKRDLGAAEARGEILAFLDDDAYPIKTWLSQAVKIFNESQDIGCVCGPALTPQKDSLLQWASGLIYSSILISGNHIYRYTPKARRYSFDFPSCNFLIRKDLFDKVGGFGKPFWPGEDTFLCLKVIKTAKKIVYDPAVLVFHHRRALFKGHLEQIKNYAFHRGYFAKKYPQNSLRFEYFIPSIFFLGVISGGVIFLFFAPIRLIYLALLGIYLILIIANSAFVVLKEPIKLHKFGLFTLVILGIITTHLTYGLYFIKGLCAKKMPEEK